MTYKELACSLPKFKRNFIVDYTDVKKINEFIKKHNNLGVYATLCTYDTDDIETAAYVAPLVFDIDSEDLKKSQADAIWVYKKLLSEGFKESDVYIYFSGSKGFHLEVLQEAIKISPTNFMMDIYKIIGENFKNASPNKTIDTKIYEKRRLFRIPFSQHEKSKLFKNLLTFEQLKTNTIDQIRGYCKKRRYVAIDRTQVEVNDIAIKHIKNLISIWREKKLKSLDRQTIDTKDVKLFPCIRHVLKGEPPKGERNDTAYNLALFFKTRHVKEAETVKMLTDWNSGLSASEIRRTVSSAYKGSKKWSCNNRDSLKQFCDKTHCPIGFSRENSEDLFIPLDTVVNSTKDYFFGERKATDLTTGLEPVDKILCGIQENDFIIISGRVGAGKSLIAAQIGLVNAKKNKNVGFMSLEMTNEQIVTRFVQQATGIDNKQIIEQRFSKDEKKKINDTFERLRNGYNLFFFSRETVYSIDKIEEVIKKGIETLGLDMLIIDHLRYISRDAKSKEHEEIDKITTKLQQLTQKYNICIILLAHFTKGDDTKPREISELLGGNSVFREATKILQIWRKIPSDPAEAAEMSKKDKATWFIVQKNRFGQTGMCFMEFNEKTGEYHESELAEEIKAALSEGAKEKNSELSLEDFLD